MIRKNNLKYLLVCAFTMCIFSFNAQKNKVSISDVDFKYNGEEIEIDYKIINGHPDDKYRISITAIKSDNSEIIPFFVDGFRTKLSNGSHSIKWSQKEENIVFDEEIQFELIGSLSSNLRIPNGKHIMKSVLIPGLGDYKLRNKKHYIFYGLAAYGSVVGSYLLNDLGQQNYASYLNSNNYNSAQDFFNKAKQQKLISNVLSLTAGLIWTFDIVGISSHIRKLNNDLTKDRSEFYYNKSKEKFKAKSPKKHINTKEPYTIAFEKAQEFFNNEEYLRSKNKIKELKTLNAPKDILSKSEKLEIQVDQILLRIYQYNEIIGKADSYMEETNYQLAIEQYKNAKSLDPENDYPSNQISIANQKIKNLLDEKKYNNLISRAETLYKKKKYTDSKLLFEEALAIFNRPQANDGIKKINFYLKEKERLRLEKLSEAQLKKEKEIDRQKNIEINKEYNILYTKATNEYDNGKKLNSLDFYKKAYKLKPNDDLRQRINFVENSINPNRNLSQSSNSNSKETYANFTPSDVDINIPESPQKNSDVRTYVLIIGNENYSDNNGLSSEVNVDFAINDAKVFEQYCIKTFGISKNYVKTLTDATATQMQRGLDWLSEASINNDNKIRVIFYYSGHGLPDERKKEPYLIPTDVDGNHIEEGIKLSKLYADLNNLTNDRITVFLDACFSGGARNESLLARKGIKINPVEEDVNGKMVVFASSSGDQSSGVFKEKKHGYFTYFLLKILKEKRGLVSYQKVADYLKKEVQDETFNSSKKQTPSIKASSSLRNDWENWKFR